MNKTTEKVYTFHLMNSCREAGLATVDVINGVDHIGKVVGVKRGPTRTALKRTLVNAYEKCHRGAKAMTVMIKKTATGNLRLGIACCCTTDQFDRKKGRLIADNRRITKPKIVKNY